MKRLVPLALLAIAACRDEPLPISAPSGQSITPHETLFEDQAGNTIGILRYIAPAIARDTGTINFAQAEDDLEYLCQRDGIDLVNRGKADQIIVSLIDQPSPRGETNPDVTKFIALFRVENETCIWELF